MIDNFCSAKISDFNNMIFSQQNVGTFEVTMKNILRMQILET